MKTFGIIMLFVLVAGLLILVTRADNQKLGDGYFYLPNYEAIDVGYPDGSIIYKSTKKNLYKEVVVRDNILSVVSDRRYIGVYAKGDLADPQPASGDRFYLVDKISGKVYGPLGDQAFLGIINELEVPGKIKDIISEPTRANHSR